MAGFLYFVSSDLPSIDAKAAGLGYAMQDSVETREAASGPGGRRGVVMYDPKRHEGKRIGYYRDQQTWRKLPADAGLPERWIGYWSDAPPTPDSLKREKMIRGASMRLADGHQWQIPIVRRFDDAAQKWESELPTYLDYDDNGRIVTGSVREEYASLWDATAPIADREFAAAAGESPEALADCNQKLYGAVVALLQANYVVALPELIVMRTLDEGTPSLVALASCRYDTLMKWLDDNQKKTSPLTPNGETTADGVAA